MIQDTIENERVWVACRDFYIYIPPARNRFRASVLFYSLPSIGIDIHGGSSYEDRSYFFEHGMWWGF